LGNDSHLLQGQVDSVYWWIIAGTSRELGIKSQGRRLFLANIKPVLTPGFPLQPEFGITARQFCECRRMVVLCNWSKWLSLEIQITLANPNGTFP